MSHRLGRHRRWPSVDAFSDVAAVLLAMGAAAGWAFANRTIQIYHDEWSFVLFSPANLVSYLIPHNEHWSTVSFLVFQALLAVCGIGSQLPYVIAVCVLHGATATSLFFLIRRYTGNLVGLVVLAGFLVLSAGSADFLQPVQISWQLSMFPGVVALTLLLSGEMRAGRLPLAGALLLISLASSGIGVAFVAGATALLLSRRPNRRVWAVVGVGWSAYAVWFAFVGRAAAHPLSPLDSSQWKPLISYVLTGRGRCRRGLRRAGSGRPVDERSVCFAAGRGGDWCGRPRVVVAPWVPPACRSWLRGSTHLLR
jgi:hypothetical protein